MKEKRKEGRKGGREGGREKRRGGDGVTSENYEMGLRERLI